MTSLFHKQAPRDCPQCQALYEQKASICPKCGYHIPAKHPWLAAPIAVGLLVTLMVYGSYSRHKAEAGFKQVFTTTASTATDATSNWTRSEKSDPEDNTKAIYLETAATGDPYKELMIRFKNEELRVYVAIDSEVYDLSPTVRVTFDHAPPVEQIWSRGDRALLSPAPFALLTQLESSDQFSIEYHLYRKAPKTVTFNLKGLAAALPPSEMAFQKKKYEQQQVAAARQRAENEATAARHAAAAARLRARVAGGIRDCAELEDPLIAKYDKGKWCWSDPNNDLYKYSTPFNTREEAFKDAMWHANLGLAFKN